MGLSVTINRPVWLSEEHELEFDVTVNSNSTDEMIRDVTVYKFNDVAVNINPVLEALSTGLFPVQIGEFSIDESAANTMEMIIVDANQALIASIRAITTL